MLDFNHRSPNERINYLIDCALVEHNAVQKPRTYLGGSRLGVACPRALQYEFFNVPRDKPFTGQTLRIFAAGHLYEELAIDWLRKAGFDLRTQRPGGGQYEFQTANGLIAGHVDGVIVGGSSDLKYPALWECKSMKHKKWTECVKNGVAKSHPIYAAQIAVYQAYMGLTENPALFTAINKDTQEGWFELVAFNPKLAQEMSDKGVRIIQACQAGELLPRAFASPDHVECKWCDWSVRCWEGA